MAFVDIYDAMGQRLNHCLEINGSIFDSRQDRNFKFPLWSEIRREGGSEHQNLGWDVKRNDPFCTFRKRRLSPSHFLIEHSPLIRYTIMQQLHINSAFTSPCNCGPSNWRKTRILVTLLS